MKKGLAALRFLSVSIIAFLLLSPFIKSKFVDKVNPVIVFAHDNSESILLNLNTEDSTKYINNTNEVLSQLSEEYQIDCRPMRSHDLNGLRISLAIFTTKADVDYLLTALREV